MNESTWDATVDPTPMFQHVQQGGSLRKLRLFMCGCSRIIWERIPVEGWKAVVETAENYVEGLATEDDLQRARSYLYRHVMVDTDEEAIFRSLGLMDHRHPDLVTFMCPHACATPELGLRRLSRMSPWHHLCQAPDLDLPQLLRDIFGNPFRPVAFDPSWRTSTVVALAEQMYGSRDFAPMPILADALQDAGCDNEDILAHCRGDGPHVRGCWVVDLVLGKQ